MAIRTIFADYLNSSRLTIAPPRIEDGAMSAVDRLLIFPTLGLLDGSVQ